LIDPNALLNVVFIFCPKDVKESLIPDKEDDILLFNPVIEERLIELNVCSRVDFMPELILLTEDVTPERDVEIFLPIPENAVDNVFDTFFLKEDNSFVAEFNGDLKLFSICEPADLNWFSTLVSSDVSLDAVLENSFLIPKVA